MSEILPQHWLRRENEPHRFFCPKCNRPVTKWHKHWSDKDKRLKLVELEPGSD